MFKKLYDVFILVVSLCILYLADKADANLLVLMTKIYTAAYIAFRIVYIIIPFFYERTVSDLCGLDSEFVAEYNYQLDIICETIRKSVDEYNNDSTKRVCGILSYLDSNSGYTISGHCNSFTIEIYKVLVLKIPFGREVSLDTVFMSMFFDETTNELEIMLVPYMRTSGVFYSLHNSLGVLELVIHDKLKRTLKFPLRNTEEIE